MPDKIKTLWLNLDFIDRDLHSSQRKQILRALTKQNVEVRANFNFMHTPLSINGLDKIWMIKYRSPALLGSIFLLLEQQIVLLKNLDVDVVVVRAFNLLQCIPLWFMWRKVLRQRRPKFVLDVRSLNVDPIGNWQGKLRQIRFDTSVRLAFRHFDGLTLISDKMKRDLQRANNNFEKKVCVWSSGVNPKIFNPKRTRNLRNKLDFRNRFVIMYHGVLSPNRGLQQAIEAIAKVKENHSEIMLVLLGAGPAETELEERVRNLGLNDHVLIHPPVPFEEVPKYIQSVQVGILPFPDLAWWNTSSPIKLHEYLSMGKPVIVTDIAAHRNVLGDMKFGFFIPNHQADSIARGIEAVYKNKSDLLTLGEIAREFAIENSTWEKQAHKIKTYFEYLLS